MPSLPRSSLAALLAVPLLAGTAAAALPDDARITPAGLGPVKLGMTERQVERASGRDVEREGGRCSTATLERRVQALFWRGRLARIYVSKPRYDTRAGIAVGDSQQAVYDAYGDRVVTEPHEHIAGGRYLEVTRRERRLVFETDGERVVTISTGRIPQIDWTEGCA